MSHSVFSPSSAHRWLACPASIQRAKGFPDRSNEYAREGTAAHIIAARCLEGLHDADQCIGEVIEVDGHGVEVTQDMSTHVQTYVDAIWEASTGADDLYIEQRVDFSEHIGVDGQTGTADAIIVRNRRVSVHDLKFGRGHIVSAQNNPQALMYALGAVSSLSGLMRIDEVSLHIHQPRRGHYDEHLVPVSELMEFAAYAKQRAQEALSDDPEVNPGADQCRWCPAFGTPVCVESTDRVRQITADGFDTLDDVRQDADEDDGAALAEMYAMVEYVQAWADRVTTNVKERFDQGKPVAGLARIETRKGAREWSDSDAAEDLLKSFRLKREEMYDKRIISPTKAEKLLANSPKRLAKVQDLVTRRRSAMAIVPADDPRVQKAAEDSDFGTIPSDKSACFSDLLGV